jgi:hypothetical protein
MSAIDTQRRCGFVAARESAWSCSWRQSDDHRGGRAKARYCRSRSQNLPVRQRQNRRAAAQAGAGCRHGWRRRGRRAGPRRRRCGDRHGHGNRCRIQSDGVTPLKGDPSGDRDRAPSVAGDDEQYSAKCPLRLHLHGPRRDDRRRRSLPVFGLPPSPIIATAAMALSSVGVIGNALHLRSVRLGQNDKEDAS